MCGERGVHGEEGGVRGKGGACMGYDEIRKYDQ